MEELKKSVKRLRAALTWLLETFKEIYYLLKRRLKKWKM